MLQLSFKQTNSELMVRAASTVLFNALERNKAPLVPIGELSEHPQYGFTASAVLERVGPRLVRITDLQDSKIDWNSVPFCKCDDPDKYILKENDILFARTGATTGKTYLVHHPHLAVFASYLIRLRPKSNIDAGYLYSFFQSENYWLQISEEKEGSAQPNVNGEKLATLKIPSVQLELQRAVAEFIRCVRLRQDGKEVDLPELPPPLAELRRIVARIEQLAAQVQEARDLRKQAEQEVDALIQSALYRLAKTLVAAGKLGDVLSSPPRNGWSARCDNAEGGIAVLSLGAVTGFRYRASEFKRTSLYAPKDGHFWLKAGDLLITRSNTPELVGHAAIYDGSPAPCIYPDLMMRLHCKNSAVESRFVWYWLRSPLARDFISQNAKGTSPTMKKISQGTVMSIPFPSSLSLTEQRRIIAELDDLQEKTDTLAEIQTETSAELAALMPSILDKAFRGEL